MEYIEEKLDILAEHLVQRIKNNKNFFQGLTIVVPSQKLASWFKAYWLNHESSVLMSISYKTIDEALLECIQLDNRYRVLNSDDLKLILIKHLFANRDYYEEIKTFIEDDTRLYNLADKLSGLFVAYDKEDIELTGWQKEMFEAVINEARQNYKITLNQAFKHREAIIQKPLILFGFVELNQAQQNVIDALGGQFEMYRLKRSEICDVKTTLISAPSKLREIEAIHGQICQILQKDTTANYKDFLVLAPNISEYASIVRRVFKQDNEEFPDIPFSISDRRGIVTDASEAMNHLFEIINQGFFTRLDFYEMISNKTVQTVRNISNEDVKNWMNAIISMNVFRDKDFGDDWQYAKRRLLLSKVTDLNDLDDNIVSLNEDKYIPFASIGFSNDSMVRFVQVVNDLKAWLDLGKNCESVTIENLNLVKQQLDCWLSILDENENESNKEYKGILRTIRKIEQLLQQGEQISFRTLLYALLDASKGSMGNAGTLFTRGISFASLDEKCILSSRYIFLLNANTDTIPSKHIVSEIDLRGETDEAERELNAVWIQYQNAQEHFYVSYINKDLTTDGELYPSSFVLELLKKQEVERIDITLDETRGWDALFTRREYKNKDYYYGLLSQKPEASKEPLKENAERIVKVRLKDMSDFLKEPLKHKATALFGYNNDLDEKIRNEYEPFELQRFDEVALTDEIVQEFIEKGDDYNEKRLKEKLVLNHKLPDINPLIRDAAFEKLLEDGKKIYQRLENFGAVMACRMNDLSFDQWVLTSDASIYKVADDNSIKYFDLVTEASITKPLEHLSKYVGLYAASLMDVAGLNDDKQYQIYLYASDSNHPCSYMLTSERAKELLEMIYAEMNHFDDSFYMHADQIANHKLMTFSTFKYQVEKGGWSYYADRKLFDYDSQLGYDGESFFSVFKENQKKMLALVEPLVKEDSDE